MHVCLCDCVSTCLCVTLYNEAIVISEGFPHQFNLFIRRIRLRIITMQS